MSDSDFALLFFGGMGVVVGVELVFILAASIARAFRASVYYEK